jgi:hypothetical protein
MTVGRGRALRAALAALLTVAGCGPSTATSPWSVATPPPSASHSPAPPSPTAAAGTASPAPSVAAVTGTASEPASTAASASPGRFAHIYLVIMENKEYGSIVGSGDAPYLNRLIAKDALATHMYAVAHPSQPNYLALVSGSTQGVTDDGVHNIDAPNLFDQIEAAGRTWRVYEQGYVGSCSTTGFGPSAADGPGKPGPYARKHNPAISFTSISGNPARCAGIVGLKGFDPSAADFELIVPNQVNDMHDTDVRTGDDFLAAFLPSILGSAAYSAGSLLIVTWDEGDTNDHVGGHIATILATPGTTPGTLINRELTHYSVLRTIEDAWGMPALGAAKDAAPIPVTP